MLHFTAKISLCVAGFDALFWLIVYVFLITTYNAHYNSYTNNLSLTYNKACEVKLPYLCLLLRKMFSQWNVLRRRNAFCLQNSMVIPFECIEFVTSIMRYGIVQLQQQREIIPLISRSVGWISALFSNNLPFIYNFYDL